MWEINLSSQITTFLFSMLLGAIFCVIFDFTRGLRIFGLNSKLAVFITDIIYFLIITFFNFCFLLTRESGQIRGYVFIGEALGFFIFRLIFSQWILAVIKILHLVFSAINRKIMKIKTKSFCFLSEKTSHFKEKLPKYEKKGQKQEKNLEK